MGVARVRRLQAAAAAPASAQHVLGSNRLPPLPTSTRRKMSLIDAPAEPPGWAAATEPKEQRQR